MTDPTAAWPPPRPSECNAALVLADGAVFWGRGIGATGQAVGEVCFNTSITGYQEILTDPSYAAQIITLTFPHIGNVGANYEDLEAATPAARGLVIRDSPTGRPITAPSSRSMWLKSHRIIGLSGVDTRRLTRLIRDGGRRTGSSPTSRTESSISRRCARRRAPGPVSMDGSGARRHLPAELRMAQTAWRRGTGDGAQDARDSHRRGRLRHQAQYPAHARRARLSRHRGARRRDAAGNHAPPT